MNFVAWLLPLVLVTLDVGVANGKTVTVSNWVNDGPFDPITIDVGDEVLFEWSFGRHNVWQMSDFDCNFIGNMLGSSGSVSVNIFTEPGTYYIGCRVGSHCSSGEQKIMIEVVGGAVETPVKRKIKKRSNRKCDEESLEDVLGEPTTKKKAKQCRKACLKDDLCFGYEHELSTKTCILLGTVPSTVKGFDGFECGFLKV